MKVVIVSMILSIVYLVVMEVVNKKLDSLDFSNQNAIVYESSESAYYSVKIFGAVNNPGTYTVAKGSNLAYLISLAGGLKDSADESTFSLNSIINGKTSYYIPSVVEGKEKVSLNDATLAELDTLPGIGNVLANRIITYRSQVGKFSSIEEIMNVNGIGESLYNELKDLICL